MMPIVHKRQDSNLGRLLNYLFGPGKHQEHVNPRLVAAWDGAGDLAGLQPPFGPSGRPDVRRLTDLLEQPVRAGRRPPPIWVWHCSVRNHHSDRILSDQQWGHIAGEIMAAVGLAPHGDPDAVRWIGVRHDDQGIHIVATLVRQDGRTAWPWRDYLKTQAAARDLEVRYHLYRVGPVDRTAREHPTAAEMNKTDRKAYGEVPRNRLRREVRAAAAAATGEADFVDRLRKAGVLVKLRESTINPGEITGYAVGLPGRRNAAGETVWYGGGRLAPDLTLPKLRHRWTDISDPATPRTKLTAGSRPGADDRAETLYRAAGAARTAAADLKHLIASGHHGAATAVAQAAADVLTAAARTAEGRKGGPITDAAEAFDRASRLSNGKPPPRHRRADQLRAMARLIAAVGRLTGDKDTTAALLLIYNLAAIAENLADLRETQQRLHQVRDARLAAQQLRQLAKHAPAGPPASRPTFMPTGGPAASPSSPRPSR